MSETGKLLQYDVKELPKSYKQAEGKRRFESKAIIYLISPVILFIGWTWFSTRTPGQNVKIDPVEVEKEVISQQKMLTQEALIMMLSKQLTPENQIKKEIIITATKEPEKTPTVYYVDGGLQNGLDPDRVMNVLRNLPYPGMELNYGYNERITSTRDYKISFYFPPYGGINCEGRYKCSYTASGKYALDGVGIYAACPPSMPFGTKLIIFKRIWICEDRGSAIDETWIDLMYPYMPYGLYWSQYATVQIIGGTNDITPTSIPTIPEYPTITKTPTEGYPTITKTPTIGYPTITKTPTSSKTYTVTPTETNTKTEISPSLTNTMEASETLQVSPQPG